MGKRIRNISLIITLFVGLVVPGAIIVSKNGTEDFDSNMSEQAQDETLWQRTCDGTIITDTCQDQDGVRYTKYLLHAAEPEETKQVNHPAEPEKSHTVYHQAIYGTRAIKQCIKTTISYKSGTCALSRCRDGEYSGSTGRGTCSYHGGVWYGGGPWYEQKEERYLITPAWIETVVDVPAKAAWTETIVVKPAQEAWIEKNIAD